MPLHNAWGLRLKGNNEMQMPDSPLGPAPSAGEKDAESVAADTKDVGQEHRFAQAVHQALRDFHRPDHLRTNPLLRSSLVTAALLQSPATPPTQMLRELIHSHSERLAQNPKGTRFHLVLQHTYLTPMRSQQAVADALHLSWSTYRRCLANAVKMLTASLWEAESALRVPIPARRAGLRRDWSWYIGTAVVVLAAATGAGYLHHLRRRQQVVSGRALPVTLAVLPFQELDQNPGNRYLGDGITDELISRLGQIPALRVVARTSAFSLRDRPVNVRDIGRILGVSDVIEGSVQRVGTTLRIDIALVNTSNGYEIWSDELTVPRSKIFETEDAISDAVMTQLRLPGNTSNGGHLADYASINPEARDYYLVGLEYLNNRTSDDINRSIAYFHRSIQVDKDYAEPWAGLATAYAVLRDYQEDVPPDTHYEDALNAANKAIALDPSLARVHAILGLLHEEHWQWQPAQLEFQQALRLDPSDATAHQWYGMYFWFTGNTQTALKELQTARDLDPLSLIINADLGRALCYAGQYNAALAQYRITIALAPRFALTHAFMSEAYMAEQQHLKALDEAQATVGLSGAPPASIALAELGVAYAQADQKKLGLLQLQKLERRALDQYVSGISLSWLYWNLGDKTSAFKQLERAAADHDHLMMSIFGPDGAGERRDPRFESIRRLMDLPVVGAGNP
jgi:TolB-like protein/tetratricopeptide (TPR) repeat protein